jgi:hypothetical protein
MAFLKGKADCQWHSVWPGWHGTTTAPDATAAVNKSKEGGHEAISQRLIDGSTGVWMMRAD